MGPSNIFKKRPPYILFKVTNLHSISHEIHIYILASYFPKFFNERTPTECFLLVESTLPLPSIFLLQYGIYFISDSPITRGCFSR